MNKENFFNLLNLTSKTFTDKQVIINIIITVLISLYIYWIYKKTYSGVMYSKSFNVTIILVSTVTAMVMMVIGSNLALSLGMVGALSIIRFRSAIKDPKDVGFLFWGIAVGLSAGTGSYSIAITASLIIGIILFILNINMIDDFSYLLIIKGKNIDEIDVKEVIKENINKFKLTVNNNNDEYKEMIYEVRLKKVNDTELINKLKEIKSVSIVNLVSHNGEITG